MLRGMHKTRAKQALLYICHKLSGEKSFGATVLNKVLYYADHANYVQNGKTITGFRYVKQVNGPTPDPSEFFSVKKELLQSKEIREEKTSFFGRTQTRCVTSGMHPNVTCFTPEEIALMDEVIEQFVGVTAKGASDMSHRELSWKLADLMEELPPYAYLLTEAPLTNEDITWGRKTIQTYLKGHPELSGKKRSTNN